MGEFDTKTLKLHALNKLHGFLNKHKANGENTLNSAHLPKGSYNIPEDKYEEFFILYNNAIKHDNEMYYIERGIKDGSPIKIDIDLKIEIANLSEDSLKANHFYNNETIVKFLLYYFVELKKIINIPSNGYAIITEKPNANKRSAEMLNDGFHIIFPHIVVPYSIQYYLRDKMLEKSRFDNIFDEIPYCNEPTEIFDKGIIEKGWTLYGSRGKQGGSQYLITHIYEFIGDDLIDHDLDYLKTDNLPKFLSIRNKKISFEYTSHETEKLIDEWYYYNFQKKNSNSGSGNRDRDRYSLPDLHQVRRLIECLADSRAVGYEDWIRVCWCLHNIDSRNLLEDFLEFSRKCPEKFRESECIRVWEHASEGDTGLQIGTLHWWARHDNPEKYSEIMLNDITRLIEELPETHVGIAKIIHHIYKHEYVSVISGAGSRSVKWFHFENHRWVANAQPTLVSEIYNNVLDYFNTARNKFVRLAITNPDSAAHVNRSKKVTKICASLENMTFIENVMKACAIQFNVKNFLDILDTNPVLIGFTNGVYDLKNGMLREGYPDDYISMNTGHRYIAYNSPENIYRFAVEKFLRDILPNKSVCDYTQYILSTCLYGNNDQQKFYVMTGAGGNGKSILISMLEDALGDYACPLDVALVTQKRKKSSSASPEIMELRNRRLATITEPDKDDTLNTGIIKALTGGDKISARNLFENQVSFRVKTKFILLCNDLPKPSSHDHGTWRRISVINFMINFVDNPVEVHERKRDIALEGESHKWTESFLSLLIERFRELREKYGGVIPEPPEVREYTEKYKEQTNVLYQFTREVIADEPGAFITNMVLYQHFKNWYSENYPGSKTPPKKELQELLKKIYKDKYLITKGLRDYRIVIVDQNDELEMNK